MQAVHASAHHGARFCMQVLRRPYRFAPDWWCLGVTLHGLLGMYSPFSLEAAKHAQLAPGGEGGEGDGGEADEDEDDVEDEDAAPTATAAASAASAKPPPDDKAAKRRELRDRMTLEHEPPPPEGASAECAALLRALLTKTPEQRLGHTGAADVKAHPFFGGVDWSALRAGTAEPLFQPSTDTINVDTIAAAGGHSPTKAGEHAGAAVGREHFAKFGQWEWRDERLAQIELVRAIEKEGVDGRGCCAGCWGGGATPRPKPPSTPAQPAAVERA